MYLTRWGSLTVGIPVLHTRLGLWQGWKGEHVELEYGMARLMRDTQSEDRDMGV